MDYTKSLKDIMKKKDEVLKKYRQEYVNYGINNEMSELKRQLMSSLGKLNGLNNNIVGLKKSVLNHCMEKNSKIEQMLQKSNRIMLENRKLEKQLNGLQNKSETAEGSLEESQFFYKQDLSNVIGKIICIGIIIYALRR